MAANAVGQSEHWLPGREIAQQTLLSPMRVTEIYWLAYSAYTAQHPGFKPPERAPTVHVTSVAELELLFDFSGGSILGVTDGLGTIWLADTVDISGGYGASVLFHEFVHYFQWVSLGARDLREDDDTCEAHAEREREAYTLQAAQLRKIGDQYGMFVALQAAAQGRECVQ